MGSNSTQIVIPVEVTVSTSDPQRILDLVAVSIGELVEFLSDQPQVENVTYRVTFNADDLPPVRRKEEPIIAPAADELGDSGGIIVAGG